MKTIRVSAADWPAVCERHKQKFPATRDQNWANATALQDSSTGERHVLIGSPSENLADPAPDSRIACPAPEVRSAAPTPLANVSAIAKRASTKARLVAGLGSIHKRALAVSQKPQDDGPEAA
jgi:hypothetical protein